MDAWGRRLRATRVAAWLPRGGELPADEWERRHGALTRLTWLLALGIGLFSLLERYPLWHVAGHLAGVGFAGYVAGSRQLPMRLRSVACSLGLLTAAALGVHLAGGSTEAHFGFFVVVVLLTVYEDWRVFLLAILYVLLHHGILGMIDPSMVFPADHAHDPWKWAAIHSAWIAAGGAAGIVNWRLNEDVRRRMQAAQDSLHVAAMTDSLTGLPNRRRLTADLAAAVARPGTRLALFDLDGFKVYNDTFGHLAGDALLTRLGGRLRDAVAGRGTAYRLGGDEFCVLAEGAEGTAVIEAAAQALTEHGTAFSIGNSHGVVLLGEDATNPQDALRLADQLMYEHKHGGRRSAAEQSRTVLLRALAARHPDVVDHGGAVAAWSEQIATALGVAGESLVLLAAAAELHDIGKVALPDAILAKAGPLDEEEWAFVRRHTLIGERILAGAPALAPVAELVRASHERWDGRGYPDALAGEAIPLGARIIAVCDAYGAMLAERPYRAARSRADALAELRRCAGRQFDPAVVEAFADVVMRPPVAVGAARAALA
jgi:diguanylate cyclase (GGDEF)-like protein